MTVHNCMDCPLWLIRGKTKTGEVYFSRACTETMHATMRGAPTADDVTFYQTFHKEITGRRLPGSLYKRWLKNTNQAEGPKLW